MNLQQIKKHCQIDERSSKIIKEAVNKIQLTARGIHRLLKVSRTIADLEGSDNINFKHITESLQYRL